MSSMSLGPLLARMEERIARDKEEGDIAYFHALTLHLEYTTKLVTAAVVACLSEDPERHRYGLEYRLIRSDSIGDWIQTLTAALTGPAAQYFRPEASNISRDLTQRVPEGDWRFSAVQCVREVAEAFGIKIPLGTKVALRQFFEIGATIRNRTRGHGATTSAQCSKACLSLADAIGLVIGKLFLFANTSWVYLHRNLSGKYRVSPLLGNCSVFDYLKRTREVSLPNGVFIHLNVPVHVPLVYSDPEVHDVFVPNGNFKSGTFEVLSYVTNEVRRENGTSWQSPPGRLPPSETEGHLVLDQIGNTFGNLPPTPKGRIPRQTLESQVQNELLTTDRHPIVSLTGPGGIGKTTIAIAAIKEITKLDKPPYDVILWMSARDIDLLESGPKPVTPRVVRQKDIAEIAVNLLEPSERGDPNFDPMDYFQRCLAEGAAGPTLFVFDNFETLESPADVFHWIDTHIRLPNKVLITTRFRDFVGDYPIEIGGMRDYEASLLIDQESKRLGISHLVTSSYKEQLISESEGHPYVIKILLGEVAKEQRAGSPRRIVASAEHVLTALFERTYESLTPAAQRVFLLLSSWRVFVPAVAVEAVSLRPGNERFNVKAALDELRRFSLVEEVKSQPEDEFFIGVPLAASSYGRRKLEVSPFKVAVEEDRKLLMEFGAGRRKDAHRGVLPRIDHLVKTIAKKASETPDVLKDFLPILEYLASRVPKTYLHLAELVLEVDNTEKAAERAERYLRCFLETANPPEKKDVWLKLADLCKSTGKVIEEVHALSEAALLPTVTSEEIGALANRINNRIRELKGQRVEDAWSPEVRSLIDRVAEKMERHVRELSATDCSRLAWLYLNIGKEDRAREIAKKGHECDPKNEHCLNLVQKLGI